MLIVFVFDSWVSVNTTYMTLIYLLYLIKSRVRFRYPLVNIGGKYGLWGRFSTQLKIWGFYSTNHPTHRMIYYIHLVCSKPNSVQNYSQLNRYILIVTENATIL